MTFQQMLDAVRAGAHVRRPSFGGGVFLSLQKSTVFTLEAQSSDGPARTQFKASKYIMVGVGSRTGEDSPFAFTDEQMAATDWEVVSA